ncbi:cold shock domain-containing protein [Alkalihalobacterium chitinilyticum]|uniref:Cold shock domain-containing protein n=1 Tax=Alkalihalobacterium chitinilyticum TaxID=2980103 RepID=A0ABT5VEU0_9BACI|nr:cold shock domain-containing protein [Alkalihalobacterium chitinilyticum]MDE5413977.1 cold shock domain-containing protein [Alkalihalobacterium chitinilyticum]
MKGRIKYYNELKGFGFIVAEDNNDYFFHVSNLKSLQLPTLGALVEFTGSKNEKGFSAVKIEIMNTNILLPSLCSMR